MTQKEVRCKVGIVFIISIILVIMQVKYIYASTPKTEYSKKFISMCEGEKWFIDEINTSLEYENKSIYDIKNKEELKNIHTVGIYNKSIVGKIPSAIGELYNLEYLYLGKNELGGKIPKELYYLSNLKNVDLSQNNFIGEISPSISNLKNIEVFMLNDNNLSGTIPTELTKLISLKNIDLSKNNLTGNIPSAIGNLQNVQLINLSQNELTGTIPESIVNLKNLEILLLWDNELGGKVPSSITNIEKLYIIDLSQNNFIGEKPTFSDDVTFGYQENKFTEEEKEEENEKEENGVDGEEIENIDEILESEKSELEVVEISDNGVKKYTFNNKAPYISGYKDLTVRPSGLITRQEFASILNSIIIKDNTVIDNSIDNYTDIVKNSWSYESIKYVISSQLMVGDGRTFRPKDKLTRAEFAKIICVLNEFELESGHSFDDTDDNWARDYIYTVYKNKLMVGDGKSFRPNENITRAEVIGVINNTIKMRDIDVETVVNPFIDLKSNHWAYKEILKASVK